MYDRIARVEHVDHARRSAQYCIKTLLTAQAHKYEKPFIYNLISFYHKVDTYFSEYCLVKNVFC